MLTNNVGVWHNNHKNPRCEKKLQAKAYSGAWNPVQEVKVSPTQNSSVLANH